MFYRVCKVNNMKKQKQKEMKLEISSIGNGWRLEIDVSKNTRPKHLMRLHKNTALEPAKQQQCVETHNREISIFEFIHEKRIRDQIDRFIHSNSIRGRNGEKKNRVQNIRSPIEKR